MKCGTLVGCWICVICFFIFKNLCVAGKFGILAKCSKQIFGKDLEKLYVQWGDILQCADIFHRIRCILSDWSLVHQLVCVSVTVFWSLCFGCFSNRRELQRNIFACTKEDMHLNEIWKNHPGFRLVNSVWGRVFSRFFSKTWTQVFLSVGWTFESESTWLLPPHTNLHNQSK